MFVKFYICLVKCLKVTAEIHGQENIDVSTIKSNFLNVLGSTKTDQHELLKAKGSVTRRKIHARILFLGGIPICAANDG